jgi:hypothetical protein
LSLRELDPEVVNPVTGQVWAEEKKSSLADMSPEEKEHSAAELMSLIQRLNATGVMSCQLPDMPGAADKGSDPDS